MEVRLDSEHRRIEPRKLAQRLRLTAALQHGQPAPEEVEPHHEIVMGRGIDIGDVTIERADQALQLEFRLGHQPGVDLGLDLESGALPVELAEPYADADREANDSQS